MNKNRNPVDDQFIEFLKFPRGMSEEEKLKRTDEIRKYLHNENHQAVPVDTVIPNKEDNKEEK